MSALAGINGAVLIASATVGQIDNWQLDPQAAILDTTHFGDTWKEYVAGLREWSGKFSGRLDMTDTNGQVVAYNAMIGGTTVSLVLQTTTGHSYTGTAFIKQVSAKAAVSGTEDAEYSFTGSGALTYS